MKTLLGLLLMSVSSLLILGVLMLDSATVTEAAPHRFHAHLLWIGIGSAFGSAAALVDYRILRSFRIPWVLVWGAMFLLGLVLIPGVGIFVNGARRWLPFGGQASEFAKLALILWLAAYAAAHQERMHERQIGFFQPAGLCALAVGLIFLEPDWGTAALVATVAGAMLLLGGTRLRYLLPLGLAGSVVFSVLLCFNQLRLNRLLSFLDPERSQDGVGWQGWHSVLAIGTGGIWGSFFGQGSHKFGFVPEQQTDFIFSLVGEELGLIGTTAVVLLFLVLTLTGIRIAWSITDTFGQLLASGLSILIGFQAAINLAVCTSSLPNKGIPLPFLSYGGSSTICMLVAAGLLASIALHAPLAPNDSIRRQKRGCPSPFAPIGPYGKPKRPLPPLVPLKERGLVGKALARLMIFRRSRPPSWEGLHHYQIPPQSPPAARAKTTHE